MNKVEIGTLQFEKMIAYEAIEKRTAELGEALNKEFKGSDQQYPPVFVGVLNGCFMFMADLMKQIDFQCNVSFMKLSSYHGGLESSRKITENMDLQTDVTGRDIIIVEDIVDTGNTLMYLVNKFKGLKCKSITVCALLFKPDAMEHKIPELKYVGFEIENKFVVGYGLDYDQAGRNLKDIYQLVK